MPDRCPACGSTNIMGKKFGLGVCSMIEYYCRACELFEEKNNRDPDYDAWAARWSAPEPTPRKLTNPKPHRPAKPRSSRPARPAPPPLPAPDPRDGHADDGRPLAELFKNIVADPAADAPRLAYADAIAGQQPKRAAIIRHAVEWYRMDHPLTPEDTAKRQALHASLSNISQTDAYLKDGWGHYIEPHVRSRHPSNPRGWSLERGFVGRLRTDASVLLDPTSKIFERAPIEHLELIPGGDIHTALSTIKEFAQLLTLDLGHLDLTDDDMHALARDGRLTRCQELDLRANQIGPAGFAALVASPEIRAMRLVRLDHNPCDPHMQYSWDCHGTIADMWLPAEGKAAEQQYGRIAWLHPQDDA